jgi:bifunctional UDP-N-acetylglucosamine pyrophosphorylase/glucosamine-1-phosphate N-acetyltransferase
MSLAIVILAAGQGTRMYSDLPKVLHCLADKPLISHVIDCAQQLKPDSLQVIYGHGGEQVKNSVRATGVTWVKQAQQLGTGHAVQQALPQVDGDSKVLILYGDVPLISAATLQKLIQTPDKTLALLTAVVANPQGYGRIVRNAQGQVQAIVEQKEATPAQQQIKEINTGILALKAPYLRPFLQQLNNDNSQGEYYLTDIIAMAVDAGLVVQTFQPQNEHEVMGINNRQQLAVLERHYQCQRAIELMQQGVTLRDPARFDVRGQLSVGRDVEIDINVILQGKVHLGNRVKIGANCVLRDVVIGDEVEILPNCVLEQAQVGDGCRIGPFARLRPDTRLAKQVHVGNFVEIKKSTVDNLSKINHLSYIGDSQIGQKVNIGAGTITCNYDGVHKHQTVIGDEAFIGSDTQLIAPVKVGAGATIGAGSTITRDTPKGKLTLSRTKQVTLDHWQKPKK